jgi:hypothetical protein
MRMTTINSEVTTPTSYVSRWIAQSHNAYQKKTNEFYSPSSPTSSSSSSSDFRTASNKTPPTNLTTTLKPHTTTWQAQAKSRLDAAAAAAAVNIARTNDSSFISTININNNELQEKLHRVR